jgi:hypothetical protein
MSKRGRETKINNPYCYKYLKSLYYLIKWVLKMNNYSFMRGIIGMQKRFPDILN